MSNLSSPKAVCEDVSWDEKFNVSQTRRRTFCHPKPYLRLPWVTKSSTSIQQEIGDTHKACRTFRYPTQDMSNCSSPNAVCKIALGDEKFDIACWRRRCCYGQELSQRVWSYVCSMCSDTWMQSPLWAAESSTSIVDVVVAARVTSLAKSYKWHIYIHE